LFSTEKTPSRRSFLRKYDKSRQKVLTELFD